MKRWQTGWLIVAVLELAMAATLTAHAGWQSRDSNYNQNIVAGGAAFVGACEVSGVSCVAYYAAEACATNAYSGNTVDVVDTATGNTTGTRLQCASGVVSALVSGSACTFVTGNACSSLATTCATSCVFNTIYNQMGTGTFPNLDTPAALTARLLITASVLNSKACFTGAADRTASSATLSTLAQPMTFAAVAIRTAAFTTQSAMIGDNSSLSMSFRASTNLVGSFGGTVTAAATDNVFHSIMEVNASGAGNSFMVVDGAAGSTGTLTGAFSGSNPITIAGTNVPSTNALNGNLCELLITNNALNSGQYGALNTNTRATGRWGNSF